MCEIVPIKISPEGQALHNQVAGLVRALGLGFRIMAFLFLCLKVLFSAPLTLSCLCPLSAPNTKQHLLTAIAFMESLQLHFCPDRVCATRIPNQINSLPYKVGYLLFLLGSGTHSKDAVSIELQFLSGVPGRPTFSFHISQDSQYKGASALGQVSATKTRDRAPVTLLMVKKT